jgi:hypothetical protein
VTALTIPGSGRLFLPSSVISPARKVRGVINLMADPGFRRELGLTPLPSGSSQPVGFHTEGDVIRQTADGIDTNLLWREFTAVLNRLNAQRQPLVDLLTYTVPRPVERVPQAGSNANFEKASEFGVPVAVRTGVTYFSLGFAFDWYDTGARYTWKFLAEADAEQIRSVFDVVLEGDNRLVFNEVMRTLYRSDNRIAEIDDEDYNVYTFYNGDGTVPPTYGVNTFTGTHTHFVTSGAATITSGDLDEAQDDLASHGYSAANGYAVFHLVNKAQSTTIRTFKSIQNGGTARWDFIPAQGTPNFLLPDQFRVNTDSGGTRPPATYRGFTVLGSYGDALILENDFFPAGYVVTTVTGGPENIGNPIGIREHRRPELRGLRLVKGRSDDYPLQDSYWQRGFGTGVRHRGATYVMEITANASYTAPAVYVN